MAAQTVRELKFIEILSQLTLNPNPPKDCFEDVLRLDEAGREEFLALADSHHIVLRVFEPIVKFATLNCYDELLTWARLCIANEKARIENALIYLQAVCNELEAAGCPTVVIKTLDHEPDLGNDLDLYSTGDSKRIIEVMKKKFNAEVEPRSWGDRVAQKWNFAITGLREPVEIHVQRLGQMGEHTWLAKRFVSRRVQKTMLGRTFFVPAPEERIVVATLQRMYRHFYFRICDLANSAAIVESGALDMVELKRSTELAGIWPGVATYLKIVSDYMQKYRGHGLNLPPMVLSAAVCGGEKIRPRARFLRVPILPEGAALYSAQVTKTAFNGDVPATFRLGLLPYLATAAAVSYKLTGSDKGIW